MKNQQAETFEQAIIDLLVKLVPDEGTVVRVDCATGLQKLQKMSQMKEVLQEAGDTLEAVLRLVVPGHGQLRRKMETQKEYLAAFVISSLVIATVLAL